MSNREKRIDILQILLNIYQLYHNYSFFLNINTKKIKKKKYFLQQKMEIENQSFNQLYKNTKFLDKQTAFFRSQSITGLPNYKVHFTFEKETNSFNTYEEVEFNLTSEPFKKENENKHFFIDYDSKIQP